MSVDEAKELSEFPLTAPRWSAEFNAKYWREAAAFVEGDKATMNRVRIEPCSAGGCLIIVSNGVVMAVFRDETGKCNVPFDIPYRQVEARDDDRIRIAPNVVFVMRGERVAGGAVYADGEYKFPEWRKYVPSVESVAPVAYFDPALLSRCGLGSSSVALLATEPRVAVFRPSGRTDVITFAAAMHSSDTDKTALAWLAPVQPDPPQAEPVKTD